MKSKTNRALFQVLILLSLSLSSALALPNYAKEKPASPGIDYDKDNAANHKAAEPLASYSNPQPAYKPAPVTSYKPAPAAPSYEAHPGMPYDYGYAVKDQKAGLDYGQKEKSDGNVVTGEYRVLLPDGRTQIVSYRADANGYVAKVSYEGVAKPYVAPAKAAYASAPQPAYAPAPQPTYSSPAPAPQPKYTPQPTYTY